MESESELKNLLEKVLSSQTSNLSIEDSLRVF
jgi:hypothetical protein